MRLSLSSREAKASVQPRRPARQEEKTEYAELAVTELAGKLGYGQVGKEGAAFRLLFFFTSPNIYPAPLHLVMNTMRHGSVSG
jgi:hypothetical protein